MRTVSPASNYIPLARAQSGRELRPPELRSRCCVEQGGPARQRGRDVTNPTRGTWIPSRATDPVPSNTHHTSPNVLSVMWYVSTPPLYSCSQFPGCIAPGTGSRGWVFITVAPSSSRTRGRGGAWDPGNPHPHRPLLVQHPLLCVPSAKKERPDGAYYALSPIMRLLHLAKAVAGRRRCSSDSTRRASNSHAFEPPGPVPVLS